MNPLQKLAYYVVRFFTGLPGALADFFSGMGRGIVRLVKGTGQALGRYFGGFAKGDLITKGSYFVMGLGHFTRGQVVKGVIYLVLEVLFILYMVLFGGTYLGKFFYGFFNGGTVGNVPTQDFWNEEEGIYEKIAGDNSFKIILYGVLTFLVILFFLMLYFRSVAESRENEATVKAGRRCPGFRQDLKDLTDKKFHLVLLLLPMIGLLMFTVIPLITMILIAFTNYDASTEVPQHLFSWVGLANFGDILGGNSAMSGTFLRVLGWTLVWAFFATFTNYFGGMVLALLINQKIVKWKKLFRTVFVATIAVPQFVSLLIMSKMLTYGDSLEMSGIIVQLFHNLFGVDLKFGVDIMTTRIAIIIVNMWIGVPYSMLICSGILMNIPQELYESSRIDGAGPVKTFFSITLPYMLFVTGPYLITQFIGNINNFNVIYLLSGGAPGDLLRYTDGAKSTDLLITWLYQLSLGVNRNYKLASVIGILVFVISAVFSLMVYNNSSAVQKEDEFQ